MTLLRLGTRKSRLALAQSTWVKQQIEAQFSDITIELTGIETQADESRGGLSSTTPLSELDGKNFFVKELDDYVLEGKTDISVHSFKDLSLDRPDALVLAAIPKRELPHDMLFCIKERVQSGKIVTIGTSAPRRLENVPVFMKHYLPKTTITMEPIRGNVTTRLGRLHEPLASKRNLDAVVLAEAGVRRLLQSEYQEEMRELLKGVSALRMPLDRCPTAPGQGALAIECRKEDTAIRSMLATLHCADTAQHVARERQVLQQHGGGCHQAFGATSIEAGDEDHYALYIRGKASNGTVLDAVAGSPQPQREQWIDDAQNLIEQ